MFLNLKKFFFSVYIVVHFSSPTMEGQFDPGEHRQRLPGVQRHRGGDEPRRLPQGTPG